MSENQQKTVMATRSERKKMGKGLRERAPRSSHGDWAPAPDRPDPISLLQAQDEGRLEHLLPIKYGRMLASPFAFLRGSAAVMAADLALAPATGLHTQLCGDAHLSNFGVFATPERKLVFDINDFDETYPGPWEWDLKRLAASAVVAGRENGLKDKTSRKLTVAMAETYRWAMARFSEVPTLDVWYYHVDEADVLKVFEASSKRARKSAQKMVKKAHSRTQEQTLEKLTQVVDGRRRIVSDPPLLVPFSEYLSQEEKDQITEQDVENTWLEYLDSLPPDRRQLLSRFRLVDGALRVGGVGSVGTRCGILLFEGGGQDDAIILQQKETGPSVLEPYLAPSTYANDAERVVQGQRLMQAASDIFLGWHQGWVTGSHYYWRQLKDMKGSFEVAALDETGFRTYVAVCSICLARAHARTGDAAAIRGYLGGNDSFAQAIGDFSVAYADQTERDFQALVDAVKSGRVEAETGI
jgi:uncharacterized protein (DUF2252 family)